jgi:hypothetical protein
MSSPMGSSSEAVTRAATRSERTVAIRSPVRWAIAESEGRRGPMRASSSVGEGNAATTVRSRDHDHQAQIAFNQPL